MKKNELLNKIADISSRIMDAQATANALARELKEIMTDIEEIPDEVDEIED